MFLVEWVVWVCMVRFLGWLFPEMLWGVTTGGTLFSLSMVGMSKGVLVMGWSSPLATPRAIS